MKPTPYVTRRAHGRHPAGSKCTASRDSEFSLKLTFEDGEELLLGPRFFAEGLENPLSHRQPNLFRVLSEKISKEVDLEIMVELDGLVDKEKNND